MFLHGGIDHILFNMIALALFGFILERIIGSKRFLIVYFISGIIAGVVSTFFYTASIGASGAIFGVMGALGVLRPRMVVYVSYVPMPMALAVVVWIILNFGGLLFPGEVAYAAHIGGLASGLIYGFYLRKDFKENYAKKRSEHMSDKEIYNWENRYIRQ
jgi:membrane associated rhomboid family serine protease